MGQASFARLSEETRRLPPRKRVSGGDFFPSNLLLRMPEPRTVRPENCVPEAQARRCNSRVGPGADAIARTHQLQVYQRERPADRALPLAKSMVSWRVLGDLGCGTGIDAPELPYLRLCGPDPPNQKADLIVEPCLGTVKRTAPVPPRPSRAIQYAVRSRYERGARQPRRRKAPWPGRSDLAVRRGATAREPGLPNRGLSVVRAGRHGDDIGHWRGTSTRPDSRHMLVAIQEAQ